MSRSNLTIIQGATWQIAWPITDLSGAPIDLTGWTVRSQVRPSPDSSTVYYEWSTAVGNASVLNSRVTLSVRPVESSAWTWTDGAFDIELTDLLGRVARIVEGTVSVSPEVTR